METDKLGEMHFSDRGGTFLVSFFLLLGKVVSSFSQVQRKRGSKKDFQVE